jgi:oxygen-independent coproporphyrinogen-3 oxidase
MGKSPEISHTIAEAAALYEEYEMDCLPTDLQRDSRYYYYLSVYPGLKQTVELDIESLPTLPETVETAYIHTPYCTSACSFCSYLLTTVREEDTSPVTQYLETVKSEVLQRAGETNLDLSYLYFGGGTPSLIPNKALESFFEFLDRHDVLNPTRFGTIELHPEFFQNLTRAQEFITILRANGVGRVSLGFQSSSETILADTNRGHGAGFLREAVDFLKQNGMLVSLDLIYGLPGLGLKQWQQTLEDALACDPDSIATYFLFVNPGTVMHTQLSQGEIELPTHHEIQTQHIMARTVLKRAGYYELPNDFYAKTSYSTGIFTQDSLPSDGASLPLGAGSYGFYDNTQFFNQFSITEHRKQVEAGNSPIWRGYRFAGNEGMHRDIMFSLKNSPYIDCKLFEDKYGTSLEANFSPQLDRLSSYGLLTIDDNSRRILLTDKGQLCVEEIACQFEIPDLAKNALQKVSSKDRRKLEKHNFAPLYGLVSRSETLNA